MFRRREERSPSKEWASTPLLHTLKSAFLQATKRAKLRNRKNKLIKGN